MRKTRFVLIYGERMALAEAAERTGISYDALKYRFNHDLHPILGIG